MTRVRLSLVALLAATEWAELKYLRDALGLSDSALSKQPSTLEAAGYVRVRKGFVGKGPHLARLTPAGLSGSHRPRGRPTTDPSSGRRPLDHH